MTDKFLMIWWIVSHSQYQRACLSSKYPPTHTHNTTHKHIHKYIHRSIRRDENMGMGTWWEKQRGKRVVGL